MSFIRLIARLDIKGPNVIKGIQMDGLRVVGPVADVAKRYYDQGADELIMIDAVASLYGNDLMVNLMREVTADCFVPVTVGGGIRVLSDADALFGAGADKVAINTAALARPELITDIAEKYGSQAVVVHIEAKKSSALGWECYTESGRQPTGVEVVEWALRAQEAGAGELLITNVDRDGTKKGIDSAPLEALRASVNVPLVASSGIGSAQHVVEILSHIDVDGVAMGAVLHQGSATFSSVRSACSQAGIPVRVVTTVGE